MNEIGDVSFQDAAIPSGDGQHETVDQVTDGATQDEAHEQSVALGDFRQIPKHIDADADGGRQSEQANHAGI